MKRTKALLSLAVVVGLALAAYAGEEAKTVTVTGNISCGKCTLKKSDLKDCTDVLVVAAEKGAKAEYYLVKNSVLDEFGHTCMGEKAATVTGSVAAKEGKMWLTASKMEAVKKG